MDEGEAKKYTRISKATGWFMISFAIFYDLLELSVDWIPGLGQILALFIDVWAVMHFALWFMLCRVSLVSSKKIVRFWLLHAAELLPIPLVDFFVTISTISIIALTRTEDKLGIRASGVGNLKKKALDIRKNRNILQQVREFNNIMNKRAEEQLLEQQKQEEEASDRETA